VAGYLGPVGSNATASQLAGRAAMVSAASQGVMVATGMQSQFNWKAVAASAAGAAAGQAVGGALGPNVPGDGIGPVLPGAFGDTAGGVLAARVTSGLAAGITVSLARGGRVAMQQVAADSFGNAIGQSIVDSMQPTQGMGPWSEANYQNGSDIESDQRARNDALYGLGGGRARLGNVQGNAAAQWADDVDRGIKDQARALNRFDAVSQRVWGQEDADSAVRAQAANEQQNRRAEATARELKAQAAGSSSVNPGMSQDDAYRTYMAYGGRTGSYSAGIASQTQASLQDRMAQIPGMAPGMQGPASTAPSVDGFAGYLLGKLDDFNNSPLGKIAQALPPEGAVVGGVKAGLIGLGALSKVDDVAGIAAKGIVANQASILERVSSKGASFNSGRELRAAMSPAPGEQIHHIVEQTPSNVARFGEGAIHNTANALPVAGDLHIGKGSISAFYSSKQPFTEGMTVRQWLRPQSFDEQYQFGTQILRDFGVVK
ncbi:MAG: hypothetical protein ABI574_20100, partial [Burkholderiales bacterium]